MLGSFQCLVLVILLLDRMVFLLGTLKGLALRHMDAIHDPNMEPIAQLVSILQLRFVDKVPEPERNHLMALRIHFEPIQDYDLHPFRDRLQLARSMSGVLRTGVDNDIDDVAARKVMER